ncbi:MAG: chromosome segregation SMC family protein, partial [Acidimicrobiales bacterium]
MFLKRLTMRGFKSFADTTTLEFEPGVTAVVGPNGSGKSNVVDAVAWVLGAQSTRLLRSSRMDDVIFAGTAQRAALGRAEVALTLDNSAGRLNIDGAEVTVSRTLFRNGESEYAINGTTCRLLDVQELLGDSGVGRQQHMIIGQGQLDSILSSNPENRRAVIEEAAGVLKHRRRKERSERRLAATQENLERLGDLVREVRRQMRPLERQAASARTYAGVEAELRAARATLFAARLARYGRRLGELDAALETSAQRERELRAELVALDAQATTTAAEMGSRREETLAGSLATVRSLLERARGLTSVIDERRRALDQALVASADENVIANLEADAAHLAEDLAALAEGETELDALRTRAGDARAALEAAHAALEAHGEVSGALAEESLRGAREQVALLERAVGDARERERRVRDEIDELRARLNEAEAALARARAAAREVAGRLEAARTQRATAEGEVVAGEALLGAVEDELAGTLEAAARAQARAETLERAHDELSGAGGRAILGGLEGVLGAFLDLIEVETGYERAVESAAGASVGAMVVEGRASARQALAALRREGGAGLILAVAEGEVTPVVAPAGCRALRERVRARVGAPAHVERVLDALFARAVVAPGWEAGVEVAIEHPDLVVVTDEGDRFAASGWRVASGRAVVTRQTVEEAAEAARAAGALVEPVREARERAAAALARARAALAGAARELAESEAMSERVAADAARLEHERDGARRRLEDLGAEADGLLERVSALETDLLARRATLPALEADLADLAERVDARRGAEARVASARAEAEALLAELTAREAELTERRRLIEARRDEVERRLEGRATEREAATRRRVALEADRDTLGVLRVVA